MVSLQCFAIYGPKNLVSLVHVKPSVIFKKFIEMCVEKVRKTRRFEGAPSSSVATEKARAM